MKNQLALQHDICALFEINATEDGGWRIVTPLQYCGSGDQVVVHADRINTAWEIHDDGDSVLNANLLGFDAGTEAVCRWANDLHLDGQVHYDVESECVRVSVTDERLLALHIIRVAEAAQQLFTIATQPQDRRPSTFKEELADVISSVATLLDRQMTVEHDLPMMGGLKADFLIEAASPLIIIAATSAARLMEAELIHMQLRQQQLPGFVLAIAENPHVVGLKQFERANYFTGKTVSFDPLHLTQLVRDCLAVK